MRLMRYITSLLLAATLLVTGAAVDAKKPDEDKSDKSEKWQRQERREAQENGRRDRYDERQGDGRQYEERRYEPVGCRRRG